MKVPPGSLEQTGSDARHVSILRRPSTLVQNGGTGMTKRSFALGMMIVSLLVGLAGCGTAVIDWVNVIRFQGITYLARFDGGRDLQPADLGAQFASVRFRLDGNVHDPNYHMQDGDAAFLDAGTPVYRVNGYAPTFRLAARQNGRIVLFEADTNPRAKTGADLLDIAGKVASITVTDDTGTTTTPLATVRDERQVRELVTLLLAAPVDQTRLSAGSGPRYILIFHLADETQVARFYTPGSREVARGIIVPDAFVSTVAAALGK